MKIKNKCMLSVFLTVLSGHLVLAQWDVSGDYKIAGKVGIGNSNPKAKLDVAGGYIRSINHNSAGGAIVQSLYDPDTDYTRAIFSHNAYWDFTTNQWNIMAQGANDAQTILIPNKGGFNFIVHQSEGNFSKSLSHADFVAGTKMILTRDGRLGVGHSNPTARLDVAGGYIRSINHNSAGGTIMQSLYDPDTDYARAIFSHNAYWDFTTNQWNIMAQGANDAQTILIPNKGGFNFIVHQSEGNFSKSLSHADFVAGTKMILTRDGRLGVGTGNPGSFRLAVNGNIRAKEIKVETGWSDFVFEDDYDLPTLDEVEKYIKTHRHLPEIPSAKEVEENGVELGKMDSKLLQKIEELTLYMIDLNEEIKNLKNENIKLNEKIKNLNKTNQ